MLLRTTLRGRSGHGCLFRTPMAATSVAVLLLTVAGCGDSEDSVDVDVSLTGAAPEATSSTGDMPESLPASTTATTAVDDPREGSSVPSEPDRDAEVFEPGDEPAAPDPSTLPEATAPSRLGVPELPDDAETVAALFDALPEELIGATREIVNFRPGAIAARYDTGVRQCAEVGLQASDLTAMQGDGSYPEGWRAEHLVAMLASGADWAVEEAGREGALYWVTFETYCGGEDMDHDEISSSAAWGDEGSPWVFFVGASDATERDILLAAFVETALTSVESAA